MGRAWGWGGWLKTVLKPSGTYQYGLKYHLIMFWLRQILYALLKIIENAIIHVDLKKL